MSNAKRRIISALLSAILLTNAAGAVSSVNSVTASAAETDFKLSAPTVFTVERTDTSVTLKWEAVKGADAYKIYVYNTELKRYKAYKSVKGTECLIKNLDPSTKYRFKIRTLTEDENMKYVKQNISKPIYAVTKEKAYEKSEVAISDVKYTTVTEAEDWGPAVSKVILDMGIGIDPSSVSADKFNVSSVRVVPGFDFTTFQATPPAPQTVTRKVTNAYVCDKNGVKSDKGSYIAVELAISPDATEGSPFNYDFISGFNSFIDITHNVSLNASLTSAEGKSVDFVPITGAPAANITPVADEFEEGTYSYKEKSIDLSYASWFPKENAEKGSTPLIIWLHGAGEGGQDPTISIIGNKVVNLATDSVQKYYGDTGAAILAPQTPTMWLDKDGSGTYMSSSDSGYSYYTEALKGLIDEFLKDHPEIDRNRVYIGGCSNGGYMTVNMIVNYPELFAAAYPVCEAYDAAWLTDEKINKIKDMPIWITAAKSDTVVPVYDDKGNPIDNFSNNLYNRLVKAGSKSVYYSLFDKVVDTSGKYFQADGKTPYEYMGHWSWIYMLNNECVETIDGKEISIFEWLSNQSK